MQRNAEADQEAVNTKEEEEVQIGKFPFDCHYCKKKGHKKSDCFKFKKDKQAGKIKEMDEDKQEDDNSSGYSRFLGQTGETETN